MFVLDGEDDSFRELVAKIRRMIVADERYTWKPISSRDAIRSRDCVLARTDMKARAPSKSVDNAVSGMLESETIPQLVWPAATTMSEWIVENANFFKGKTVLELGCGTGYIGFVVSQFAAKVVLTDCSPVALALASETISTGNFDNCSCGVLRWNHPERVRAIKDHAGTDFFDIVIGSDIFYFGRSLRYGLEVAREALVRRTEIADGPDKQKGVFYCGSVARSDRMEEELENVPTDLGYTARIAVERGVFRLYEWRLND